VDRPGCLLGRIFSFQCEPLSRIFRGKFHQALRHTVCYARIPAKAWKQEWVVHCEPVGSGLGALKYLAPYIFRVAISNNRILKLEDDWVTFRYKDTDTGAERRCTLGTEDFIHRFLQHVLPKGFVKVRYYGLFSPGLRKRLAALRLQLAVRRLRCQIRAMSRLIPTRAALQLLPAMSLLARCADVQCNREKPFRVGGLLRRDNSC